MAAAKKILAIDGGGIRGAFSAAIIQQMEAVIGKKAGEYFDCFYGTSTGAILAAGLANGMTAEQLKQFYLEKGARMFEKLPFYNVIKKNLYWTYTKQPLEEELKTVFGDKKIFDIETPISIQTKDTETGTAAFFNNFPSTRDAHPELNLPLWQIIRASTAAPTYFESEGNRYIDGSISSYNNPSYASYIGATKYLRWSTGVENLRIYSVGTGYYPPLISRGKLDEKTKLHMAAYMIEELLDDINLLQNQIMRRLADDRKECWYRRYTVRFAEESFRNMDIPTTDVDFAALAALDGVKLVKKLMEVGELVGKKLVRADEFPTTE
jgi:uncharacterized protein